MSIQGPPENKGMPGPRPGKLPRRDDDAEEIIPPSPLGNVPTTPDTPKPVEQIWPVRSVMASANIVTFPLTGNIKR